MEVRIEVFPRKKLIGKSLRMSLADNKTSQLWKSFMTEKSAIKNTVGTDLYSIQVYDELHYFKNFNPQTEFTKCAAIEVDKHEDIPNDFSSFTIESGLYAVFLHKGTVIEFSKTMQYIFSQWLPQSEYELDNRPHFEVLGEKYKNNDPNSEKEVWIPIRIKC
ncbi:MAG: GyrI-like domain-containing protein [Maribacter sp.]